MISHALPRAQEKVSGQQQNGAPKAIVAHPESIDNNLFVRVHDVSGSSFFQPGTVRRRTFNRSRFSAFPPARDERWLLCRWVSRKPRNIHADFRRGRDQHLLRNPSLFPVGCRLIRPAQAFCNRGEVLGALGQAACKQSSRSLVHACNSKFFTQAVATHDDLV